MLAKYRPRSKTLSVFMEDVLEYPSEEDISMMENEIGGRWFRVMDAKNRTIGAEFLEVNGVEIEGTGYVTLPEDLRLAGLSDVAKLLGITKQRFNTLIRKRDDFPAPIAKISSGPVWLVGDVEEYIKACAKPTSSSSNPVRGRPPKKAEAS